ncbi:MAG: response regulator [Magnetococcales bacterium]|nr:response regulator [Magnetococcales bacterium]
MTLANRRILIIDDDEQILDVYCEVLKKPGESKNKLQQFAELETTSSETIGSFDVDTVLQGEEGVACVQRAVETEKPYAVAFIDVNLPPGINGLETAREIRQIDKNIFIIMVTAYKNPNLDDLMAALKDYIVLARKPLSNEEIINLAEKACQSWENNPSHITTNAVKKPDNHNDLVKRWYIDEVIDSINEPLIICATNGEIIEINPAAHILSKYSQKELLGQNINVLFSEGNSFDVIDELMLKGNVRGVRRTLLTKENNIVPIDVSALFFTQEEHGERTVVVVFQQPTD